MFVGLSVAPAPALRQHGSRLSKAYNNNLNEDMGMDKSRQPSGAPMHARIWLSTTQDGTEAGTPDAGGSNPSAGSHQPLVLLVEDNHINQVVALEFLALMGVQARLARNGIEALSACADTAPDLVLMDIQMPGMDGVEAAHRIRALPAPAGTAPILAMTANALAHQRAAYLAAGMDGAVAKPLSPAALAQAVATALMVERGAEARKAS